MAKTRRSNALNFRDLSAKLEGRCKAAGIPFECSVDEEGERFVRLEMPNSRQKRDFHVWTADQLKSVLATELEKHVWLGDYIAIASYEKSFIEAVVQCCVPSPISAVARAFGVARKSESLDTETVKIADDDFAHGCEIEVGGCSEEMFLLGDEPKGTNRRWSLKITGASITKHDDALSLLERLANSLFFQVDLNSGTALSLRRARRLSRYPASLRKAGSDSNALKFPKVEYDQAPITLYWYARGAAGMPLLQFLAFYQCIEFYYPAYSQLEARRRIRNILKDPTFRLDRDTDLARVLGVLGRGSRGVADERSMLRSTIRECVGEKELRDYLEHSTKRAEFFSVKTKGLTDQKIPISDRQADLRDAVANRIYDLRCKIVHTKSAGGEDAVKLLLPFSNEERLLLQDIALLRFVAQQVLIAGSSSFKL